jgi:hypothetical protein
VLWFPTVSVTAFVFVEGFKTNVSRCRCPTVSVTAFVFVEGFKTNVSRCR